MHSLTSIIRVMKSRDGRGNVACMVGKERCTQGFGWET